MRKSLIVAGLLATQLLMPLASLPAAHATVPGANGLIAFSPNSTGLTVIDPKSGATTQVTTNPNDDNPAWSASGRRIFFNRVRPTTGRSAIFSVHPDGTSLHRLTGFKAYNEAPWPLPGGGFVFTRYWSLGADLYPSHQEIYKRVAGETVRLTNSKARHVLPSPSPDGSQIAFLRTPSGCCDFELRVMDRDGSNKRTLSSSAAYAGIDWSPDGTTLGFATDNPNGNPTEVAATVTVSTGQQTTLQSTESAEAGISSVSFSPNGAKLMVVQDTPYGDYFSIYDRSGMHLRDFWPPGADEFYFGRAEWQPLNL
jgi:Tol biopolymer transport system component